MVKALCCTYLAVGDVSTTMSLSAAHATASPANDRPIDECFDMLLAESMEARETATATVLCLKKVCYSVRNIGYALPQSHLHLPGDLFPV